jgi:hypothetical protein
MGTAGVRGVHDGGGVLAGVDCGVPEHFRPHGWAAKRDSWENDNSLSLGTNFCIRQRHIRGHETSLDKQSVIAITHESRIGFSFSTSGISFLTIP